jgi:hypothetical protein
VLHPSTYGSWINAIGAPQISVGPLLAPGAANDAQHARAAGLSSGRLCPTVGGYGRPQSAAMSYTEWICLVRSVFSGVSALVIDKVQDAGEVISWVLQLL